MVTYEEVELIPADGLSADAAALYRSMFRKGDGHVSQGDDGRLWMDVYLDNARAGFPATGARLSGLFSALEQRGLYRPIDGYAWGEICVRPTGR